MQRELTRDTVLEVRYVGNHGTDLWRQVNINEINIFENGFLQRVQDGAAEPGHGARLLRRRTRSACRPTAARSNQYFGLPGQQPLPMIFTALAANNDATSALQIEQGQAGALANAIATNAARMARLTAAGNPINLFQVNPDAGHGRRQSRSQRRQHQLSRPAGRSASAACPRACCSRAATCGATRSPTSRAQGIGGSYTTLRDVGIRQVAFALRHPPGRQDELGVRTAVRPEAPFPRQREQPGCAQGCWKAGNSRP